MRVAAARRHKDRSAGSRLRPLSKARTAERLSQRLRRRRPWAAGRRLMRSSPLRQTRPSLQWIVPGNFQPPCTTRCQRPGSTKESGSDGTRSVGRSSERLGRISAGVARGRWAAGITRCGGVWLSSGAKPASKPGIRSVASLRSSSSLNLQRSRKRPADTTSAAEATDSMRQ